MSANKLSSKSVHLAILESLLEMYGTAIESY